MLNAQQDKMVEAYTSNILEETDSKRPAEEAEVSI